MHRIGRLGAVLFFLLLHVSFGHSLGIGVPQRSSSSRRLFLPFQLPSGTHPQQRRDSGPWIGLRDYLIRHVFSLSKGHGADGESLLSGGGKQCAKTRPPANLLASYGGDVVLRFSIASPDEAKALAEASNILFLDIWDFREDWVDIRLAKDVVPSLLGLLPPSMQHSHTPLIHDLAQAVFDSYPSSRSANSPFPPAQVGSAPDPVRTSSRLAENIFFQDYQPLSVIVPWMRLLASLYPTHVRMTHVGVSYEGRDIPALRVGVHPTNSQKPLGWRPTIIISGGVHAREWISVSTVTYVAYSIITSYGKSASITSLLERFDWVFVPTINPDGYAYTWDRDRLWRKNRQETTVSFCKGVDIDRSWNSHWDGDATKGNPCSEIYAGEEPFQAAESRSFAAWAKNETENNNMEIVGFFDLHSYSQEILYPYSYSCTASPPLLENLKELALGLAKAIRTSSGEQYAVMSACEGGITQLPGGRKIRHSRMETGGGSALDWFSHEMQARYSYQLKLRDTGSYGFLLPKENIIPTGEEALAAINHFGHFLMKGSEAPEAEERINPVRNADARNRLPNESDEAKAIILGLDASAASEPAGNDPEPGWELKRRRR